MSPAASSAYGEDSMTPSEREQREAISWNIYGNYWTANVPKDEHVMLDQFQMVLVEQMCLFNKLVTN
jgi:hypothetical protein